MENDNLLIRKSVLRTVHIAKRRNWQLWGPRGLLIHRDRTNTLSSGVASPLQLGSMRSQPQYNLPLSRDINSLTHHPVLAP